MLVINKEYSQRINKEIIVTIDKNGALPITWKNAYLPSYIENYIGLKKLSKRLDSCITFEQFREKIEDNDVVVLKTYNEEAFLYLYYKVMDYVDLLEHQTYKIAEKRILDFLNETRFL